ncbi:probable peroxisomal acyl-coenzyme A oxidase 1 [Episyrphus balteatus]|uniref:probable peroxisomal acyl-coenzyme A oxidase 1 n=1 Tax=Episyrphus balteatus TaxID=286459 RepID=UPI002486A6B1|nr:probable peroxisomal acyl-coenzyme A oxidase 1 [Episyrphus balteatus]
MNDNAMKKYTILAKKLKKLQNEKDPNATDIFPGALGGEIVRYIAPQGNPFLLQNHMFIPTIKSQGTPEQIQKWVPKAESYEIIGTYAQTELGHGTFLRGLETRADFDRKTDEFILHSPTITAYKWWPGGLGHTSNYAVVAAQLYIDDKPYGIQMFVVQLRDLETHMPLPGLKIGEIGNKMAFQTVNNGYLGFENFRIPRTNMLMKNAQLHRDGTFVKSPASVLTYFTMVNVRVSIVMHSYMSLARAATIAIRYSAVRRQSKINPKEPEHQIIDHLTQQMKLFPEIAKALALRLNADCLTSMLKAVQAEILKGDLSRLAEMHALASCLKTVSSHDAVAGVETLRLACGGHGYMLASGLPIVYNFAAASKTYEGENTVMLLQTARFLMKAWALALKGGELVPTVMYLNEAIKVKKFQKWDGSWECMVKSLQFVAANKIRIAFDHLEARKRNNMIFEEASNLTSIELASAAEVSSILDQNFVCF